MPPIPQARYWMLTIPAHQFTPYLPPGIAFIKGQLECGEGGFLHWQLLVIFEKKTRLATVTRTFGPYHAEPTRSESAEEYVWKEESRIADTQFSLGRKPLSRARTADWAIIRDAAISGDNLMDIPPDIYVRHYNQLKRIAADHMQPIGMERRIRVYWGRTGTGKSRRAWDEAGFDAYPKDPRTKFWDGYRGHQFVVIDEFRGSIDIAHMLRWLDRYPVIVEVKGSSAVLKATDIWITSNIHPREWYPGLDPETLEALMRRLEVEYFE